MEFWIHNMPTVTSRHIIVTIRFNFGLFLIIWLILAGRTDSYAQLIALLVVFVLVLGATALVTRWIANYQQTANAT